MKEVPEIFSIMYIYIIIENSPNSSHLYIIVKKSPNSSHLYIIVEKSPNSSHLYKWLEFGLFSTIIAFLTYAFITQQPFGIPNWNLDTCIFMAWAKIFFTTLL